MVTPSQGSHMLRRPIAQSHVSSSSPAGVSHSSAMNNLTKAQLLEELRTLHLRLAQLEREETRRNRAEKALQESEERLRGIYEAVNAAIFVVDPIAGHIVDANPGAYTLLGYTQQELIGMPCTTLHPDDLEYLLVVVTKTLATGPVRTDKLTCRTKDGHRIPVELSLSRLNLAGRTLVISVVCDISKCKQKEETIQASLTEKEVLLKEVHHRVKNNMQIVSSLLSLQSNHVEDEKIREMLSDSQDRINAMALIHEKLCESTDFESIDLRLYIDDLVNKLLLSHQSVHRRIPVTMDVDDISLGMDAAIPCGLLINELLLNALKHAFPGEEKGEITIAAHAIGANSVELVVSDTGVGMPSEVHDQLTQGLGLQLVSILGEDQLRGTVEIKRRHGTEVKITFDPKTITEER